MENTGSHSANGGQAPSSDANSARVPGISAVVTHISDNKVTFTLFCTRVAQLMFAAAYVFPFIGGSAQMYSKSFMCGLAFSALRMHQRVPHIQWSQQYLSVLLQEDAVHYLLFSLLFFLFENFQVTMALLPLSLFSLLHVASYTQRLLNIAGCSRWFGTLYLVSLVELHSQHLLHAAALAEIMLMPYTILLVFSGRASLLLPFLLYRFLTLRYCSRRNPYSRSNFRQLRLMVEQFATNSWCPALVSSLLHRAVATICYLCPPLVPVQ